jgi:hypothetical protein
MKVKRALSNKLQERTGCAGRSAPALGPTKSNVPRDQLQLLWLASIGAKS